MVMMDDDKHLEALFAEAQNTPRMASDDLMARVLRDAAAIQLEASLPLQRPDLPVSLKQSFWDIVGGWTGAIGFAACTAAGLYFGYLATDLLTTTSLPTDFSVDGGLYGDLSIIYEGV